MKKKKRKAAPRKKSSKATAYHHGDLRKALRDSAIAILEEDGLAALSLRAVARKAGVSHAAPYRHYPNHEALLVELAVEGFEELRAAIALAATAPNTRPDRITSIGGAYMRFAAQRPALTQLMFGPQLPNRDTSPALVNAADALSLEIGHALNDLALGLAVWAAVHGLAMLILDNVIDLGQRRSGTAVLPARAEILLRSLFNSVGD
ncbi:MAG TPA: TetR/AcrR family transcriptional regulator [Rhizomicrobium sp.]|nr:TetR/AcrR family transcriptional regulator [Rhizomicrobium sp.]